MSVDTLKRFLVFRLNKQDFAIPLDVVREALSVPTLTPVPAAPPHFLGVCDLRGTVLTVVDLRVKFGYKKTFDDDTAMIVCEVGGKQFGTVVCEIKGVEAIDQSSIGPAPTTEIDNVQSDWVTGVYQKQTELILVVDLSLIFGGLNANSKKIAG